MIRFFGAVAWSLPEKFHHSTFIAERTMAKITEYHQAHRNFFIWASFLDPHYPQVVPSPWDQMYNPNEIELPNFDKKEHKDSPPLIKLTQNKNWVLKRQMKKAIENEEGEGAQTETGIDFERLVSKFEKIPGAFKIAPMLKYYKDFLEHGEKPFLLHGVHPHFYEEETLKKQIATYYGMISLIDKNVGKLIDHLESLEIWKDTLVIFTTDHGDYFGQHGLVHKGPFHYEDGIKLPWIVSYPAAMQQKNYSSPALQSVVDIAPTLLSLCGIQIPRTMTGKDQSQVWLGNQKSVRDHIICEMRHSPFTVNLKTLVTERYKITVYFNEPLGELYDLKRDPDEKHNLWNKKKYQHLKSQLLLQFLWGEMEKEPRPMPRIADA